MLENNPEQVGLARRHVRRFRCGVLRVGDSVHPCSFVIDGRDGGIITPMIEDIAGEPDMVLYVPNDGFDEMALLVSAESIETPFDEAKDRHLAYHGRAEGLYWNRCEVDSAKWGGRLYEGASILGSNPLHQIEPALCRRLNTDKEALAEVSELLTRVRPESPLCVGVDHLGMDVRTRVGVMRVEWPTEIKSPDQAEGILDALLRGSL